MNDFNTYIENIIGVSQDDYGKLKLAALYVGCKNGECHYYELAEHLKKHPVGQLLENYMNTKDQAFLDQAAAILTNYSSNPWLFLAK